MSPSKTEHFELTQVAKLWYAIHVRSNFEWQAAAELEGKGVDYYLPSYREQHRWKDRTKKVDIPLFPGYLFVRIQDRPAERLSVLKTRGVVRILGNANAIESVPESEIDSVKRVLEAGGACYGHPLLREGMRVRVKSGSLRGIEGSLVRVKNESRLVISIALIGQSVATEIDTSQIEPLPTASRAA